MATVLTVLHVFVCVFLIAVVLLQRGKGAEIGAVFGSGASSTVFGSRGAGNFLTKLTTLSAVLFMVTSLSLSYLWTAGTGERLFEDGVVEEESASEGADFEEFGVVPPSEPAEPAPTGSAEPTPAGAGDAPGGAGDPASAPAPTP